MKKLKIAFFSAAMVAGGSAQAEDAPMTCEQLQEDYKVTGAAEQLTDSPDLFGACEEVVMRDGAPFIKVKAVVRRAGRDTVRLYVPATDRTVEITPEDDLRVLIDGRKVRPSRLDRGQEIRIYLSVAEFTRPRSGTCSAGGNGDGAGRDPRCTGDPGSRAAHDRQHAPGSWPVWRLVCRRWSGAAASARQLKTTSPAAQSKARSLSNVPFFCLLFTGFSEKMGRT
jgi:hypothetical protein